MNRALTYGWAAVAALSASLAVYTWADPYGPWWIPAGLAAIAAVSTGAGIAWRRGAHPRHPKEPR